MGTPGQFVEQAMLSGFKQGEQQRAQRKQALSDEEHEQILGDHNNTIASIQAAMAQLGPGHPNFGALQNQLSQTVEDRTRLFHPDTPGGLHRLGELVWKHVHGQHSQPPTETAPTPGGTLPNAATIATPALPGTAPALPGTRTTEQAAAAIPVAATPGAILPAMGGTAVSLPATTGPVVTKLTPGEWKQRAAALREANMLATGATAAGLANPYAQLQRQLEEAGFSPEQARHATLIAAGGEAKPAAYRPTFKLYHLRDGSAQYFDAANPGSIPEGAVAVTPAGARPRSTTKLLNVAGQGWSFVSFDPATGIPTSILPGAAPPRSMIPTEHEATSTDPAGVSTRTTSVTRPAYHNEIALTVGQPLTGTAATAAAEAPSVGESETEAAPPTPSSEATVPAPAPAASQAGAPAAAAPSAAPPSSQPRTRVSPLPGAVQAPRTPATPAPAGMPSAPRSPGATTPAELKQRAAAVRAAVPAPRQLDAGGHIPQNANVNPQLAEAASALLDGADLNKLAIPLKDRPAAAALARQYGWQGQGQFSPRERLLMRESSTFLHEAQTSPSLGVLDNIGSRAKLAQLIQDPSHRGTLGQITQLLASGTVTPAEAEFLRLFNQLTGTVSGLSQLTRSGRVTESQIHRLMMELPNPATTSSSADARERITRLLREIDVAEQRGSFSQAAPGHTIRIGNKRYTYNGSGDTADLNNYSEVP